jgi:type I restriction enzyme S subunit
MMIKLKKYSTYKNSGVEWLGDIPEEWEVKKIKYISRFDSGFPFNSKKFDEDGSAIVVRIGDIKDTIDLTKCMKSIENKIHKNTIINKYDTLIALSGATTGKSCFIKKDIEKAYINQRIAKFNYVNSFLYYCISNEKFKKDILLGADGSAQENVSNSIIENMFIPFPYNIEQIKIALFLDTKTKQLDKAVKQKQQLIKLLKERRQILINDAVTKGIDKTVSMKNSGVEWIGEIPEHWEIKKMKLVLKINNGQDYKHVLSESGFPVIGSGGEFAFAKEFLYDGEVLLLGRKGTVDKPLYFMGKFWAVDTMFYAVVKKSYITKFLYYSSLSIPFNYYSTSTALPSMTQFDLNNHKITIPKEQEQEKIVDFIEEKTSKIDKAIDLQQQQITKLKEYKITLIDNVVTGKVRVD